MSILENLTLLHPEISFLTIENMDEAIIGYEWNKHRLIYSQSKIIQILCREMCEEDALDYFYYNIGDTNDDSNSPIICLDTFNHYDFDEISKLRKMAEESKGDAGQGS
jgi:hypothetical protein